MPFSVDKIRLRWGGVANFSFSLRFVRSLQSLRLSIKHQLTHLKSQRWGRTNFRVFWSEFGAISLGQYRFSLKISKKGSNTGGVLNLAGVKAAFTVTVSADTYTLFPSPDAGRAKMTVKENHLRGSILRRSDSRGPGDHVQSARWAPTAWTSHPLLCEHTRRVLSGNSPAKRERERKRESSLLNETTSALGSLHIILFWRGQFFKQSHRSPSTHYSHVTGHLSVNRTPPAHGGSSFEL